MNKLFIGFVAGLFIMTGCELMPRNTLRDCRAQCAESEKPSACYDFCDCTHQNCQPLNKCVAQYDKAPKEAAVTP
ncbi:hypothetical protein [Rufibacter soli]